SLGHAYEVLARFLAARLDWFAALEGQTLPLPPVLERRMLDESWLSMHRKRAFKGFSDPFRGFFEVWHFCPERTAPKSHHELLEAAKRATIKIRIPTGE